MRAGWMRGRRVSAPAFNMNPPRRQVTQQTLRVRNPNGPGVAKSGVVRRRPASGS